MYIGKPDTIKVQINVLDSMEYQASLKPQLSDQTTNKRQCFYVVKNFLTSIPDLNV